MRVAVPERASWTVGLRQSSAGSSGPWFQEVNAAVEVIPVMSGEDVQKGIARLG
jgi:hypothetical protein